MKKSFLLAMALAAIVSCTSDEFTGETTIRESNENAAISFGFDVPTVTRASGSDAATSLSNQFIVYGEKSENTDGSAPTTGNLVFQNYKVAYTANTANSTQSNTKDWEYVGQKWESEEVSNIITSTDDDQTIKYWDYSASSYTFTAVSALPTDISSGKVKITKTTAATDGNKVYDKGYSIEVSTNADLSKLYLADRNVINQTAGTDRSATNTYGGNVTFTFRNVLSQIRVGMYETIPGYSVTIDKFYYTDAAAPAFTAMTTAGTDKFYANVPNVASGTAATLTVKYVNSGDLVNQPIVTNSATAANYIALGGADAETIGLKANVELKTSSADPTYNETSGAYTAVYPQESNSTNLKLKVDYTLTAPVTSEKIKVTGATAEIPSQYLQWKPNFKYTYLFKISDNTNGSTGQSVTGLYPITFDAVVVEAQDGHAEYITTVSEPSITTFGVKDGVYSAHGNDYAASTVVYAVVEDGSSLATLSAANMKLYTVTSSDEDNFPITSASVAEALIEKPTMNTAQVGNAKIVPTVKSLAEGDYLKVVPAEDGTDKTLDNSNNKAVKFTVATGITYALVYEKTPATYTYDDGKNDYTSATFEAAGKLYTRSGSEGSYTYTEATQFTEGTTYFKPTAVLNKGVYVIKIVTCP